MQDLIKFKKSLSGEFPEADLSPVLKSLWYDGKGDWQKAHDQIEKLNDKSSAWVHAYLHRKEGDLLNADYWYGRAGKTRPSVSLQAEWELLVEAFLNAYS